MPAAPAYQVLAFPDVDATDAERCEAALLEWLWRREILAPRPIATLSPGDAPLMKAIMRSAGHVGPESDASTAKAIARASLRRGYLPAPGARAVLADPADYELWEPEPDGSIVGDFDIGGVEVLRDVVVRVSDQAAANCPHCGERSDRVWYAPPLRGALLAWARGASPALQCPSCARDAALSAWRFAPTACCARLALRFGGWPVLAPAFPGDLAAVACSRVVVVAVDADIVDRERWISAPASPPSPPSPR